MTPASKRSIEDLAARIDEGERIDWDHERRQAADEESRSIIDGYRVLAELRDSLRSQQTPSPQMPAPASGVTASVGFGGCHAAPPAPGSRR